MTNKRGCTSEDRASDLKRHHQKEIAREQHLVHLLAELTTSPDEHDWLRETDAPCLLAERLIKGCITYELEYIVQSVECQLVQLRKALALETVAQVHLLTVLTSFSVEKQALLQPWMEKEMFRCALFLTLAIHSRLHVSVIPSIPLPLASQALTSFLRHVQPEAHFVLDITEQSHTIVIDSSCPRRPIDSSCETRPIDSSYQRRPIDSS